MYREAQQKDLSWFYNRHRLAMNIPNTTYSFAVAVGLFLHHRSRGSKGYCANGVDNIRLKPSFPTASSVAPHSQPIIDQIAECCV
jgi:hypothetical protein